MGLYTRGLTSGGWGGGEVITGILRYFQFSAMAKGSTCGEALHQIKMHRACSSNNMFLPSTWKLSVSVGHG